MYFGAETDVEGANPKERLLDLLGDESLVDTVLRALAMTAERADLPTEKEVLKLASDRKTHYLSLPFMAALEEGGARSDMVKLRLGLAILFNDVAVGGEDPSWYAGVLADQPEVVADVTIVSARRAFRVGSDTTWGLFRLGEAEHAAVAKLALPAVLQSFPTRCAGKLLPVLKSMLQVGLTRCADAMPDLIDSKLASKRMDMGQRMYWLCAGLATGKQCFVRRLREALAIGGKRRVQHMATFFVEREQSDWIGDLNADALGLLIHAVGASYGPFNRKPGRAYVVTIETEAKTAVREWIELLAAVPSPRATEVLEELGTEGIVVALGAAAASRADYAARGEAQRDLLPRTYGRRSGDARGHEAGERGGYSGFDSGTAEGLGTGHTGREHV